MSTRTFALPAPGPVQPLCVRYYPFAEEFCLPRDNSPTLRRLYKYYIDLLVQCGPLVPVLKMRMSRHQIQFIRSSYCLLQERMIQRDIRFFSEAALIVGFGGNPRADGVTVRAARKGFYLPNRVCSHIADFFLPAVKQHVHELEANIKYFTVNLGYSDTEHLLTALLLEPVHQRLNRAATDSIIYTEAGPTDMRPSHLGTMRLDLPLQEVTPMSLSLLGPGETEPLMEPPTTYISLLN